LIRDIDRNEPLTISLEPLALQVWFELRKLLLRDVPLEPGVSGLFLLRAKRAVGEPDAESRQRGWSVKPPAGGIRTP
jgi:hypothetical protein